MGSVIAFRPKLGNAIGVIIEYPKCCNVVMRDTGGQEKLLMHYYVFDL